MGGFCVWADSSLNWSRYLHSLVLHTTKRAFLTISVVEKRRPCGRPRNGSGTQAILTNVLVPVWPGQLLWKQTGHISEWQVQWAPNRFAQQERKRRHGEGTIGNQTVSQNYCSSLDNMSAVGANSPKLVFGFRRSWGNCDKPFHAAALTRHPLKYNFRLPELISRNRTPVWSLGALRRTQSPPMFDS